MLTKKGRMTMPDREKVIGHLYDCLVASKLENMWVFVRKDIVGDALALLKEQEPAKPKEERHEVKVSHDWGDEVEVWSKFYCPHCGAMIANNNSQHFPRCMWCGQKVKWK